MSKTGLPDKWAKRLVAKGFVDPRYKHDVPSMNALSTATGLHTSTISGLIAGRRRATVDSVRVLVAALGDDVADWLGVAIRERYEPPPEADLLTTRQRKAITELIRSFVAVEQEELMGNAEQHPAATSEPPDEGGGSVVNMPKRPTGPSPRGQRPAARKTKKGTAAQRGAKEPDPRQE